MHRKCSGNQRYQSGTRPDPQSFNVTNCRHDPVYCRKGLVRTLLVRKAFDTRPTADIQLDRSDGDGRPIPWGHRRAQGPRHRQYAKAKVPGGLSQSVIANGIRQEIIQQAHAPGTRCRASVQGRSTAQCGNTSAPRLGYRNGRSPGTEELPRERDRMNSPRPADRDQLAWYCTASVARNVRGKSNGRIRPTPRPQVALMM